MKLGRFTGSWRLGLNRMGRCFEDMMKENMILLVIASGGSFRLTSIFDAVDAAGGEPARLM